METSFDVIVIGAGHAGTEAAVAAARRGARVAIVTSALDTIGQMSCNPAIGGVAKGTVVREVDALGGIMGAATDLAAIQFRMLNRSKGPAVWAPRAQCDRGLYRRAVRSLARAARIASDGAGNRRQVCCSTTMAIVSSASRRSRVAGYGAPAVVITTGTFLRGRIHIGTEHQQFPADARAKRRRRSWPSSRKHRTYCGALQDRNSAAHRWPNGRLAEVAAPGQRNRPVRLFLVALLERAATLSMRSPVIRVSCRAGSRTRAT